MFANKDIVPDWDMVNVIDFLIRDVGGSEPNLLSTDLFRFTINEHQPYLPMLIWGFDHKVFHSYGLIPLILMQLFAITSVVLVTTWSRARAKLKCCGHLRLFSVDVLCIYLPCNGRTSSGPIRFFYTHRSSFLY